MDRVELPRDELIEVMSHVPSMSDYIKMKQSSMAVRDAAVSSRVLCKKRILSVRLLPGKVVYIERDGPPLLSYGVSAEHIGTNGELVQSSKEWCSNGVSVWFEAGFGGADRDLVADCALLQRYVGDVFGGWNMVTNVQVCAPIGFAGVVLSRFGATVRSLKIRLDADSCMRTQMLALFHFVRGNRCLAQLVTEVPLGGLRQVLTEWERQLPHLPPSISSICTGSCHVAADPHLLFSGESLVFPIGASPHAICGIRAESLHTAVLAASRILCRNPSVRHVVACVVPQRWTEHEQHPEIDVGSDGAFLLRCLTDIKNATRGCAAQDEGSCVDRGCEHHQLQLELQKEREKAASEDDNFFDARHLGSANVRYAFGSMPGSIIVGGADARGSGAWAVPHPTSIKHSTGANTEGSGGGSEDKGTRVGADARGSGASAVPHATSIKHSTGANTEGSDGGSEDKGTRVGADARGSGAWAVPHGEHGENPHGDNFNERNPTVSTHSMRTRSQGEAEEVVGDNMLRRRNETPSRLELQRNRMNVTNKYTNRRRRQQAHTPAKEIQRPHVRRLIVQNLFPAMRPVPRISMDLPNHRMTLRNHTNKQIVPYRKMEIVPANYFHSIAI